MSKYRFKTKEQFIRDGLWDEKYNCPDKGTLSGLMNKYLGKDVPDEFNIHCDENEEFKYDNWLFRNTDYVLKEQQEYFDDLSQHIGRYIKALVDYPHSGRVKKGEIGKIISDYTANFPSQQEYNCSNVLSKGVLGVSYELLPEDYSPEQEVKEPSIEFIPGKWYNFTTMKGKYSLYVKVASVTDRNLFFMNGKSISNGHFGEADGIDKKLIENPRLVEDLSEIQKYLPEEHPDKITKQEFKVGKWYKWYQKNHGNYHYGKVKRTTLETDTLVMTPWIMQCDNYNYSGTFDLSKAEQIQEISIEQIQEFLPKNHSDKNSKSSSDKVEYEGFKKGEYIVITDNYSGGFCTNYIYKQRKDYIYLEAELDNNGSKTNGFGRYEKRNSYNWRYATQEEINEYERRGKPYDVKELHKKQLSMKEIQEECKRRFPIGCTYISTNGMTYVLKDGSDTYRIFGNNIGAHAGGGNLFQNGKWAELVSLPEENITEVPEYIETIDSFSDYFIQGKIYKVKNSNDLTSAVLNCNDLVNFNEYDNFYVNLIQYRWKPSTKEAYEKQKSQLKDSEELTTKIIMGNDPCKGTPSSIFTHDEIGQFPSISSDYWKNIPKFEEQKEFDIYGPTPDLE